MIWWTMSALTVRRLANRPFTQTPT